MSEHLVIVGGGQAAAQAVQSLRQQSFAGPITLVGDEPYPPYQRPPLSKKYLAGELTRERLLLRPAAFYAEKGVTLEQNARVEELDPRRDALRLRDGRTLRLRSPAARDRQPRSHARSAGSDARTACITCARSPTSTRSPRRCRRGARVRARRRRLHRPRGSGRRAPARLRRHGARGRGPRHVARASASRCRDFYERAIAHAGVEFTAAPRSARCTARRA